MRYRVLCLILISSVSGIRARQIPASCGTTPESANEALALHRRSVRARALTAEPAMTGDYDAGNIAVITDGGGVVVRQNDFNLDQNTVSFIPAAGNAAHYQYSVAAGGYDDQAASSGASLPGIGDDDSRPVALPFAFPYFGANYDRVFVNSDGNLTFTTGDDTSEVRSLGRMTGGPPRISPLFDDLDPTQPGATVRVFADSSRVVVSWVSVPEWSTAQRQTFQVALFASGRIDFAYNGTHSPSAVVGIAPGNLAGNTSVVDFRNDPSGDYSSAVVEQFSSSLSMDIVAVAQRFYEAHDDAYDYLVIYNNEAIYTQPSAVAYESTVRSSGTGYGAAAVDHGPIWGSPSRLKAVLDLQDLSQYPKNPNSPVPRRFGQGDTPLTILGHESGHLFLARASIPDPNNPSLHPMLNSTNLVHWGFPFNSEASLLEGERIIDKGPDASPRFFTTDLAQGYSPLDQYLMGFLPPDQVPPSFVVLNSTAQFPLPLRNISFDGTRHNVTVDDVIEAMGPRIPDSTVAQRRFRYAFILVTRQGADASAALAQIDTYRQQFETFLAGAAANHASADTVLAHSLKLSVFPAAGVVEGDTASASIAVAAPAAAPLTIQLQAAGGNARIPATVTIPAGESSVSFAVEGVQAGVDEITAVPADPAYETAFARLQVAGAERLRLVAVSGDNQVVRADGGLPEALVVQLTDANRLAYPGARLTATASMGQVEPSVVTDDSGVAVFHWTPGRAGQLQIAVAAQPAATVTLNAVAGAGSNPKSRGNRRKIEVR